MRKLFYEDVLIDLNFRNGKVIKWIDSVGKKVHFIYDDIEGDIIIIDYDKKKSVVKYQYKDMIYTQTSTSLKDCELGNMLFYDFKYDINDILINCIKIINRKIEKNSRQQQKIYSCQCIKCNHYFEKDEYNLQKLTQCPVCGTNKKYVVPGINDIPTTTPWLIPYFQGGYEEAIQYTCGSDKKIYPICPDCGKVRNKSMSISRIYYNHSIGCKCSDGRSYPNKFITELLKQLNVTFENEIVFSWAKQYRYDAVIYLNKITETCNIIIEMDGDYGHGKYLNANNKVTNDQVKIGRNEMLNDMSKEIAALKNGNYLIRIDCRKSDMEYIKTNILNSKLAEWFDLSKIDWIKCDLFACKNIVREISDYIKNNTDTDYNILSKLFNISKCTVGRYLKRAKNNGMIDNQLYKKIINNSKKHNKLYVYNIDKILLKVYNTATDFVNNSLNDFGFTSSSGGITKSIKNNTLYKGKVYLTYNSSEQDYLEMIGELN